MKNYLATCQCGVPVFIINNMGYENAKEKHPECTFRELKPGEWSQLGWCECENPNQTTLFQDEA